MNPSEEVPHLRLVFKQRGHIGKMELVTQLRDKAIAVLKPLLEIIPKRAMSQATKKVLLDKGINLEWDLTTADAYDVSLYIITTYAKQGYTHNTQLTKNLQHPQVSAEAIQLTASQNSAAQLLYQCTKALEENTLTDQSVQSMLDAYAGLDIDLIEGQKKFRKTQAEKAKKPRNKPGDERKEINQIIDKLACSPEYKLLSAKILWNHFFSELQNEGYNPKEIGTSCEYDYKDTRKRLSFKAFQNQISKRHSQTKNPS